MDLSYSQRGQLSEIPEIIRPNYVPINPASSYLFLDNPDEPSNAPMPKLPSTIQLNLIENSQFSPNRRGMNLSLSTPENPADFTIEINNNDTLKLSSELLKERCLFFARSLRNKQLENLKLEINIPFPNMILDFFLWIYYLDQKRLLRKIHHVYEILEIYAIGRIFELKEEFGLEFLLKSRCIQNSYGFQPLPNVWDRKYIDFQFVKKILNAAPVGGFGDGCIFGGFPEDGKIYYLFDWLGEKSCYREEDIEELKNSEDFKNVGNELENNGWLLKNINYFAILAKKYPIASQSISITRLLSGLNLS